MKRSEEYRKESKETRNMKRNEKKREIWKGMKSSEEYHEEWKETRNIKNNEK